MDWSMPVTNEAYDLSQFNPGEQSRGRRNILNESFKRFAQRDIELSILTGISVRIPIGVTALCSYPVSLLDSSSGASLTTENGSN